MTTAVTDLDHAALQAACALAGFSSSSPRLLHRHATSIYLLESVPVVVRITAGDERWDRARTAVTVARWLSEQGFPATAPAEVDQPVEVDERTVTFWRYYPQEGRAAPSAEHLGALLRELHRLPAPPVVLQPYPPLQSLGEVLDSATSLGEVDRVWLRQRRTELLGAYQALESELGTGFVHGDAYPGNTLWDCERVILGDWDEVAHAPRELDLANTHRGARTGRPAAECEAFSVAYGWDVTRWSGYSVLREMRDLHTLAAYIRRSERGDSAAIEELRHRLRTLRQHDPEARWHQR